jgi:hypothetical protein
MLCNWQFEHCAWKVIWTNVFAMRETKQSFYDVIMGYDEDIHHIYVYIIIIINY